MEEAMIPNYFGRFNLKVGIPADFWIIRERQIGRFIKEKKLRPVSR